MAMLAETELYEILHEHTCW